MSALVSEPFFWLLGAALALTCIALCISLVCMARAHLREAERRVAKEARRAALDDDVRREALLRAERAAKRPIGYQPPHVDHEQRDRD